MRLHSSASRTASTASVADVRRLEVVQLIGAFAALHREGILDDREYDAKCLGLVHEPDVVEPVGQR